MRKSTLNLNGSGHLGKLIRDLISYGWRIDQIPASGKVPRNGIPIVLSANAQQLKLRIFAYKVTTSGRSRPHERRIEITTTYSGGLKRRTGYRDVVLGIDTATGKYVGVDNRRLSMGGDTHNASSFFDLEGLSVSDGDMLINPRNVSSSLFKGGIEHHAFFDAGRLSEYLFNQQEIHSGRYGYEGMFSGVMTRKKGAPPSADAVYEASGEVLILSSASSTSKAKRTWTKITPAILSCVEEGDFTPLSKRKLTPAQLKQILSFCDEIGALGEQYVLAQERKRLRRRGLNEQADKVERVSLRSVGEGYDILSFEDDGTTKRYLEVKTTSGRGSVVDVTATEWKVAKKYKSQYYLVRVINVQDAPEAFYVRDPHTLEADGKIIKTAAGWKIDLRLATKVKV